MADEPNTYDIWVPYAVVHAGDVILDNNAITRQMKVRRASNELTQDDIASVYIKIVDDYMYISQEDSDGENDLIVIQRAKLPEFCRLMRKVDNG